VSSVSDWLRFLLMFVLFRQKQKNCDIVVTEEQPLGFLTPCLTIWCARNGNLGTPINDHSDNGSGDTTRAMYWELNQKSNYVIDCLGFSRK
jgi:hypothetical protein